MQGKTNPKVDEKLSECNNRLVFELSWLITFGEKHPLFKEGRELVGWILNKAPGEVNARDFETAHVYEAHDYARCKVLVVTRGSVERAHGSLIYISHDGWYHLSSGLDEISCGKPYKPTVIRGEIPGNLEGLEALRKILS